VKTRIAWPKRTKRSLTTAGKGAPQEITNAKLTLMSQ
jgi:hypothetical protein